MKQTQVEACRSLNPIPFFNFPGPLPIKSSISTMILTTFSTMQENRAPFLQLKAKPYSVLTTSVLCDLPSLVIPFPIFLPVYFHSPSDSSSSAHKHACLSHPRPYPINISSDTNLISILFCLNFLKEIPTVIPHFPFSFQFSTIQILPLLLLRYCSQGSHQ